MSPDAEKLAQARSLAYGALGGVRGKELSGQEDTPRWPSNARRVTLVLLRVNQCAMGTLGRDRNGEVPLTVRSL